ncbi:MAG: DegT/DnrJ/EryC1/StrS family aminotransferase, partial [Cytophagales bacterium]|nr:DegT/DnrJ/EryC1/StrS family aminotransferase [Cytophagales bacterium]
HLKESGISAVFHYSSLHTSKYFLNTYGPVHLPNCERYSDGILRLPLYVDLKEEDQELVIEKVRSFKS